MSSSELKFRVLGPLAVERSGDEIPLGGPRQRLVLAMLLLEAGRSVPAERLVDHIWGDAAPSTGTGPLRTYIWHLRRLLTADTSPSAAESDGADPSGEVVDGILLSRPGGYMLDIDPLQVDSTRFEQRFAASRAAAAAGQHQRALGRLGEALDLWRGPAFGDLAAQPVLQPEAARLDQLLLGAQELRADLMLATGQHVQVTTDLEGLARANPERERLWAMLMTALYRSGRQTEALRGFQEAREHLIEELGIEPGPELRDLEQRILQHDPSLDWQAPPEPAVALGGPEALVHGEAAADDAPETAEAPTGTAAASGERSAPSHNLPRQLTSFVGRAEARRAVARALSQSPLVTLCGSGGCGKTRLALAVAEDMLPDHPGGVWFVDLAAVSDPNLVARTVAEVMGVEADQSSQLDLVCRRIADQRVLLLLDNCEHVVEQAAETIEQVLARCPSVTVLATSREELRLGAETVWRVPALSLPEPEDIDAAGAAYQRSEAEQLFVDRAASVLPDFAPTGDTLQAVAQICRQLDGLPLALELAAALVGSLPVADIAARLDDRLRLLASGPRQGIPRHRTLRTTLDWSFDLLDEPARTLFVQLGVFVGDFTLTAVEAVAGPEDDPLRVVRGLSRLVRTSMIGCVTGADGAERYRMLETIRQYAAEQLEQRPDRDEIHRRHARYYADFAAEAERHVHRAAASAWLARLELELPNLRKAVTWAISHDDVDTGMRLAGSLRWFFGRMAVLDEAAHWLHVGLTSGRDLPPELRLMALTAAGTVAYSRGDIGRNRHYGEEAVALARQLEEAHPLAMALIVLAAAAVYEGDLARAEECFEEAQELCARDGDRWGTAWMLTQWSVASRRAGDLQRARAQLQESLAIFRSLDDRHGQVLPLVNLALADLEDDQVEQAVAWARQAVRLAVTLGDRQFQHVSLCVLGEIELSLGQAERARELLVRSIRSFPGAHHLLIIANALEALARLAGTAEQHREAVAVLGFTQQLRERWQLALSGPRVRERSSWLDRASAAIGEDEVKQELDRGRGIDLDAAVELAETATSSYAIDVSLLDVISEGSTTHR